MVSSQTEILDAIIFLAQPYVTYLAKCTIVKNQGERYVDPRSETSQFSKKILKCVYGKNLVRISFQ